MNSWLERTFPRINILWRGEWQKGFLEPARYLYDHELVIVSQGACQVTIENQRIELKEGSFIIIPPATLHISKGISKTAYRSCIHFDWQHIPIKFHRPICSFYPHEPKKNLIIPTPEFIPKRYIQGTFSLNGPMLSLVETLFFQWDTSDSFQRARARGVFWEILVHLLWGNREQKPKQSRIQHLAYRAKDILDQKMGTDVSIQIALASLGFSYPHLCRPFHKNFGITPNEYLNAKRLEQAKVLLKNPKMTITEVAYASGFRDAGYFTRKFRQQNGITPKQYR